MYSIFFHFKGLTSYVLPVIDITCITYDLSEECKKKKKKNVQLTHEYYSTRDKINFQQQRSQYKWRHVLYCL